MALGYPYHPSSGAIRRIVDQLRSAFPPKVNSDTLKKWTIAPKNESILLNVLRFLNLIDSDGNKISDSAKLFLEHDDTTFSSKFAVLVKDAYSDLFSHFGDKAWTLPKDKLVGYFRSTDESSDTVGKLQATCFQTLATISGYVPVIDSSTKPPTAQRSVKQQKSKPPKKAALKEFDDEKTKKISGTGIEKAVGMNGANLTVRIELNLPISDDQSVYDRIFRSIRDNLMNG
jgi:hypothetical protein